MTDYATLAKEARREVLTMVHKAGTSHIASNFSVIDMATVLYDNLKPGDRVVWSKGWAAATIYYFLYKKGVLTYEQIQTFPNPPYLGLAEPTVSGVEVSGGAMGHGLPVAVGIAIGKKRAKESGTVYCIMSDGEMQEGTTWESALIAGHNKLDNLVVLIDYNKWVAMGRTEEVADVEPFQDKWKAFNWLITRGDGHNHQWLWEALNYDYVDIEDESIKYNPKKPLAIICDTVKGKGVSFFENPPEHADMGNTGHLYHYKNIDEPTYKRAMEELA